MPTPRPKWNDPGVQDAAVMHSIADVAVWVADSIPSIDLKAPDALDDLAAVVKMAVRQNAEAYTAGRALERAFGWPVNMKLLSILSNIYARMPREVDSFVHAWVMQERVRFPAKVTDFVKFRAHDGEHTGHVYAVIAREARGIVEVRTGPTSTIHVSVNAEDVIAHHPASPRPKGGGTPPTGGTPIALRGPAVLKDKKAA